MNCTESVSIAAARTAPLMVAAAIVLTTASAQQPLQPRSSLAGGVARRVEERTGTLYTRDGLRLRVITDAGNVRIITSDPVVPSGPDGFPVTYRIRIETDSSDRPLAKQFVVNASSSSAGVRLTGNTPGREYRGRFWVNFEVHIPRRYNVDVVTQAGNIELQDIKGRVSLVTSGGNISAGRIGGEAATRRSAKDGVTPGAGLTARLETGGGHITVQDVKGDLHAVTVGGHINLANVQGNAVLRSGGGHIRAGTIQGKADLETGGGNIYVERAGSVVSASTVGGQIDFGEAAGSIRARTGGGVIRVLRVARPTVLETSGGNIFLTKVQSAVRASSGSGTITAWFTPEGREESSDGGRAHGSANRLPAGSQLESRQGDIVVYLPRELAATIEASVEMAGGHRIEADPSLPIKLSYSTRGPGGREVRGEGILNGGGEVLRLKTSGGSIRLKVSDWLTRSLAAEWHRRALGPEWYPGASRHVDDAHESGAVEEIQRRIEQIWWGGVRVAAITQQQKLIQEVTPVYPDVAKQAGIEGTVRLRAVVAKDGAVQGIKVLSGEGILANAAVEAVRQWRYQPTWIDGRPVNVVTTITVDFHLR